MNKSYFLNHNATATFDPNMKVPRNPAPEKMARAIAFFEKNGLPPDVKQTKKRKKPSLTPLQTELLSVYAINPSEQQMLQLKDFLGQLFKDNVTESEVKREKQMAA
jgi:hypothetical protein